MPAAVNCDAVQPVRSASGASIGLLSRGERRLRLCSRRQRTELVWIAGTGYRDLRWARRPIEPRRPDRTGVFATLIENPGDSADVLRARRVEVAPKRRDQLLLVGIALGEADVHAAGCQ